MKDQWIYSVFAKSAYSTRDISHFFIRETEVGAEKFWGVFCQVSTGRTMLLGKFVKLEEAELELLRLIGTLNT